MSMSDLTATLLDIARASQPVRRRQLLAGFSSAHDARLFAGIKREEGLNVTVKSGCPDSPYPFEVYAIRSSV